MIFRVRPGQIVQIFREGDRMWAVLCRTEGSGCGAYADIEEPGTVSQQQAAGLQALHGLLTTLGCSRLPVVWRP